MLSFSDHVCTHLISYPNRYCMPCIHRYLVIIIITLDCVHFRKMGHWMGSVSQKYEYKIVCSPRTGLSGNFATGRQTRNECPPLFIGKYRLMIQDIHMEPSPFHVFLTLIVILRATKHFECLFQPRLFMYYDVPTPFHKHTLWLCIYQSQSLMLTYFQRNWYILLKTITLDWYLWEIW